MKYVNIFNLKGGSQVSYRVIKLYVLWVMGVWITDVLLSHESIKKGLNKKKKKDVFSFKILLCAIAGKVLYDRFIIIRLNTFNIAHLRIIFNSFRKFENIFL